ncbi:recombinase family protein [Streptomyces capillispiralis]|uniref:recombinase family protein n=1 Tax=Streptomyces capillispiralis TaxID=68182 RepID=UPI003689EB52
MTTNTVNRQRRAVIYTRISEDRNGDQLGVGRQEDACRKLASDLGWLVVRVLEDDDRTAYGKNGLRAKRPAYAELLDLLAGGQADAVIVWHVDRLYRQARDLEPLIDVVERTGAAVRPVTHGELDLASASGRMVARILASVSTHEIEHAVERMREKKAELRAAGHFHGGVRGFGHKPLHKRAPGSPPQVPQTDPREAELIRQAAQDVLAYAADSSTGKSLGAICRDWNARKIRTPRGKEWGIPSLRAMLTGARLAGLIEHNGEIVGQATWEPILDAETWRVLRRVLRDPSRNTYTDRPAERKIKYLGTGLYLCHKCAEPVRAGGAKAGEQQRYRCAAGHVMRYAAPIDDFAERVVVARLARPDARTAFSGPGDATPAGPSMDELSARHAALNARLEGLVEAFADDDEADPVEFRKASRSLRNKITAIEQQIADVVTAAAAAREPGPLDDVDMPELVRRHEADPEGALTWWRETYDLEQRRKILATLAVVTILPGRRGRAPRGGAPFDPESVRVEWVHAN